MRWLRRRFKSLLPGSEWSMDRASPSPGESGWSERHIGRANSALNVEGDGKRQGLGSRLSVAGVRKCTEGPDRVA